MKSGLLEPEPCDTGGGFVVNCEVLTSIQLVMRIDIFDDDEDLYI